MENIQISNSNSDASDSELESETGSEPDSDSDELPFDTNDCLFCPSTHTTLTLNTAHMQRTHGFFIPNADTLTDSSSFLTYLHVLITRFHECLTCGCELTSAEAARAHMRDRGHCSVDVQRDRLGDFWEGGAAETTIETTRKDGVIGTSLIMDSGRILRQRKYREARVRRAQIEGPRDLEGDAGNAERSVVQGGRREMGLAGLSDAQRHSLRAVEKKMIRVEMRARNEFQGVREQKANRQKHFRPDVPGRICG